jgi:Rrf2 family protein
MLKINKKVEYALVALKYIATNKNELTSAREICDIFNTPFDTTAKVMQAMSSKKILESVKGVKGGHRLGKNLKDVSYMDLARTVEGKEIMFQCESGKKCSVSSCNIVTPIRRLSIKISDYLEKLSIDELLFGGDNE